ncbi:MAG: hypothetical protein BACD_01059 [Bacteroides rodentium]
MSNINEFFHPINPNMSVDEKAYEQLQVCVSAIDAVARSTNQSMYIIDYNRKNFLYVSPNPLFLCGYTPQQVQEMGYLFYEQTVPEEEIQMLQEINLSGFDLYYKQEKENRQDMTIQYDFHLQYANKKKILINHKLTPILLNENGDIWLALCVVSLSPRTTAGNVILQKKNAPVHYSYSFNSKHWKEIPNITLSERETDILRLSAQGHANNEIGEHLFIDANTVKFHKKNIFQKLEAENITEVIAIAANLRLI